MAQETQKLRQRLPLVSEGEDWLAGWLELVKRVWGSVIHGYGTLMSRHPVDKLCKLEADRRVLGWVGVLLVSTALFSVLYPVLAHGPRIVDPFSLAVSLGNVLTPSRYLAAFVPLLALGLAWALVPWFAAKLVNGRAAHGVRLLAATTFALALSAWLIAFLVSGALVPLAPIRGVLGLGNYDFNSVPTSPRELPTAMYAGLVASLLSYLALVPLYLALVVAAIRASRSLAGALFRRRWAGLLSSILTAPALVLLAVSLPAAILMSAVLALSTSSGLLEQAQVAGTPRGEPQETVEVEPLTSFCKLGPMTQAGESVIECQLLGFTSGAGSIALDYGEQLLYFTPRILGPGVRTTRRLSTAAAIATPSFGEFAAQAMRPPQPLEQEGEPSTAELRAGGLGHVSQVRGSVVEDVALLELGRPFSVYVRLEAERFCSFKQAEMRGNVWLYVGVSVLAAVGTPSSVARRRAIGPWDLKKVADECETAMLPGRGPPTEMLEIPPLFPN
ncbi:MULTISPECIES: hypothetical protein [unclassified Variovorax]|uniref:hypothetical protein n=1 Tax=unclassified Variovorax TaxID=663243 RepID=UPI000838A219|nr:MULTISPECIES: hypothetical protein [unclassified Variovorax]PNG50241.1 hypothetical protein CHC06_05864 [Variovorax sp. B2]PNG51114.1 hypothetical protein CHC07_05770 [Variovorax sp. B4]VTU44033.1 hypothetical protein H6P1_00655 [Variovorax sp. PBL-H6]